MRGRALRLGLTAAALAAVLAITAAGLATAKGTPPNKGPGKPSAAAGCQLGGSIKHVIFLQFDNTHFRRDNPNVPSDLEQMPNLLNFLTRNASCLPKTTRI